MLPTNFLPTTQALRRPLAIVTAVTLVVILLTLTLDTRGPHARPYIVPDSWRHGPPTSDPVVAKRLSTIQKGCRAPDRFEDQFGRANLRMTRSYEGSRYRVETFINKIIRGEPVVVGAVGGSVTRGHGVAENERWMDVLYNLLKHAYPGADITMVNGAIPASGSDYFSFCFPLHIPAEVDLVFVELGVNDEALMEHADNMDDLVRGLLDLPKEPAVVLVEVAAFSEGVMAGSGGRMHLSVAQYYDLPVLSQRLPLVSHFANFPQLTPHYFVTEWWGHTDTRHLGPRGHHDVAQIIGSFLRDVTCDMINTLGDLPEDSYDTQLHSMFEGSDRNINKEVSRLQSTWPSAMHQWEHEPSEDDLKNFDIREGNQMAPGMWASPLEYGRLPRLRAMEPWNTDVRHIAPPFRPHCLSTRAQDAKFNLTPVATSGWYWWVLDFIPDKPYLVAHEPGSTVTFELEVNVGIIKMYSLRSQSYGLGKVDCWIDDNIKDKVTVDGYWDNPDLNIGRFSTLGEGLSAGKHNITCKLLAETSDPEGRTFFRMISVMGR